MKRAFISLFLFIALASAAVGQNPNDWFTTVWDMSKPTNRTNSPNTTIAFPGIGTNYKLYWENINNPLQRDTVIVSSSSSSNPYILTVPVSGIYRIKVHKDAGVFYGFDHFAGSYCDNQRLIRVEQWGTTKWSLLHDAFSGCKNMDITATDTPDLTGAAYIDLNRMFQSCESLVNANGSMANWNTERVRSMYQMFISASSFNAPIGNWNTQNVTNMDGTFYAALSFNQPLNWNTQNVTNMKSMFALANSFNKPFGSNWNTQSVTNMSRMFSNATAFNQDISSWNTQNVTEMGGMFSGATSFDQPLGSIKINSVVSGVSRGMHYMLFNCGMSCENLSTTLDGWATQATALGKNNVILGDISTVYNAYNEQGRDAIAALTAAPRNWTITGGRFFAGCILPSYYVSEWDLSKPVWPARPDADTTLITNLITGELGCTVEWENLGDPTDKGVVHGIMGSQANPIKLTGLRPGAKYRVVAYSTTDNHGYELSGLCAENADNQRLIKVTQWGTTQWTSLTKAFIACGNMDITATDKPDLSVVTDLSYMFNLCGSLVYNTSIGDWNVSHITNMTSMFAAATEFNQPLNNWDVSNVTNMKSMFAEAIKFNQPLNSWTTSSVTDMSSMFAAAMKFNQNINSWDVSKVTTMQYMFGNAEDFNQPLNSWVTSKVTNMSGMFSMASKFNQDINSWDVSKVTNMSDMFNNAKVFNKPLNNWDVSKVTNMSSMFRYTDLFNQDITGWNVSAVTNMQSMFERALVFNQDIKGWNTRNVTDMRSMFKQAAAFDRDLGLLRIDALTNGTEMFASSGMSCHNYSNTLKGWAESSHTPSNVNFATQTGTPYGRHGRFYRDKLVSQKNWTISGDNLDLACSIGIITPDDYVSEWDLSKPAKYTRPDAANSLFTNFLGTNFVVEYINLADPTDKGIVTNANGTTGSPFKLTGLSAGAKYRLIAYPNPNVSGSVFKGLDASGSDAKRLSKVTQWGTNEWKSLTSAFSSCENMDVTATDRPTLTGGISLASMFRGCTSLVYNPSINNWGTADVTDMSSMFWGATSFNQPIGGWNTGSVTAMSSMFWGATSFNQPIGDWNTGNVTDMAYMFTGATSFNQPINWNVNKVTEMRGLFQDATSFNKPFGTTFASSVSNVRDMGYMFLGATAFNQPIVNWNTISVHTMPKMFENATSFDQPLDGLKFDSVSYVSNMLYNCGMNCENLSITLAHWATLNKTNIDLGNLDANKFYNAQGQTAINTLRTTLNWTIYGGAYAPDCVTAKSWFTTVWDMSKPTYRTNNPNTTIAFPGNGTNYRLDWEDVDDPTNPAKRGTVTVSSSSSSNPYILTVPVSGTYRLKAYKAGGIFYGFQHNATDSNNLDSKRLIAVEQWGTTRWDFYGLNVAFYNCINMDVTATDKPNLSQCTSLNDMFCNCRSLVNANGSISNWNTENITDMNNMFSGATSFNQPLNSWNTAKVAFINFMFFGATSFNQPLNSWNTAEVTSMRGTFSGATSFNQPLNSWNTAKVTDISLMFSGATSFNQPLNSWNTAKVTDMSFMFSGATSFNQPLNSWNTAKVTNMRGTFSGATSFNQPLNSWNTAKVTDMAIMFQNTAAFNQRLDSFKINDITAMESMFSNCGISCENLSTTLDSWKTQAAALNKNNISLDISTVPNMYNETGRDAIAALTARGWTITGGRFAPGCVSPDYYISEWDLSKPAKDSRPDAATSIVTNMHGTNFVVKWKNLTNPADTGTVWNATSGIHPFKLTGLTAGAKYILMAYPKASGSVLSGLDAHNNLNSSDTLRLTQVKQWGTNKWQNLEHAFFRCSNMDITATDAPYLYGLANNSLNQMFRDCKNLVYNPTIDAWRTDSITSMNCMFQGAKVFNQPIGSWNTAKVTNMGIMFREAEAFNQNIGGWNTENVTHMDGMFLSAKAFNKPIGSWNTANVIYMGGMFCEAESFNQDISGWNTAKDTSMYAMFFGAKAFDKPIGSWNTGQVKNMGFMFSGAEAFNQDISGWNTANVTDISFMFSGATSFNRPLYWNVEKVRFMVETFKNAEAFDQDLSRWTLKNVQQVIAMFEAPLNKGMSCKNYSKTLQGWALNPLTKTGLNFSGQLNRQYNLVGKEARDILTKAVAQGGKGWTISGDTYDQYCGVEYVWTGNASTDITDAGNWQGGIAPQSEMIPKVSYSVSGPREKTTVAFSPTAAHDMYIPALPSTPDPQHPGHSPDKLYGWIWGNMINNSTKRVVIMPGANLLIHDWVIGSSTPADVDKILVKADSVHPNGALILNGHPCDKPVYATVEMYSKARKNPTPDTWIDDIDDSPTKGTRFTASYRWQFIGIPVEGEVANVFYGSYLRKYDETYNDPDRYYGKWRKIGANETWQTLEPFAGYEVTSRSPKVYVFKGRLLHCPQELTLTRQAAEVTAVASSVTDPRKRHWGLGQNIVGNSYTHSIQTYRGIIWQDLHPDKYLNLDSMPIEATIYLYNTGNIAEWAGGSTWSGAGSWEAVPTNIVTNRKSQSIPSMQGFMIKFRDDTLQLKGVGGPVKLKIGLKNPFYAPFGGNQQPQRAPQADPSDKIHGYLKIGLTSRRSVSSVHLVEAEGTTDEFDNGWDGMQLNTGRSSSATLFVPSTYGDLQVSTSDNIVGDRFGIVNNGDTTYRLTVIRHRLDNRGDLYLYDVATNRYMLLDADTTVYDFTSEGSGNVDKRFVITDRRNADDPNTAVDEVAEDLSLYGYVDGRHTLVVNNHTSEAGTLTLLDVSGKAVYTSRFGVGFSRHDLSHLPAGVYIARLEASVRRATVKAITMK